MSAVREHEQPVLSRRELLGFFAAAGASLVLPQGTVGKDDSQPVEVPLSEIVIPPEFEIFREIVNNSVDTSLIAPFLRQMYERLSQDQLLYFGVIHELGNQQVLNQYIYKYVPNGGEPSLVLYVQDPGRDEKAPSQFTLDLQFGRNVRAAIEGQENEILLNVPNLFSVVEQEAVLGVFKTTPQMENQAWISRLDALKTDGTPLFTDGISGITRGYYGEDRLLRMQTATMIGKASIKDVYLPFPKSA